MIYIRPSPIADTRTCDYASVTKSQLADASCMHITDVAKALDLFRHKLTEAADTHDSDKLDAADWFHADFVTGFAQTGWWDNHRKVTRHHLAQADGVPHDVNLIDVLEYIADCVMAGMARSGSVYDLEITPELLMLAFRNTTEMLKSQVTVIPTATTP